MTVAHIIATASLKLNMEGAEWPIHMTDQQKLDWWLDAAKKEPALAFEFAEWIVTGRLEE